MNRYTAERTNPEVNSEAEIEQLQRAVREICEEQAENFPSLPFTWNEGMSAAPLRSLPICIDQIETPLPLEERSTEQKVIDVIKRRLDVTQEEIISQQRDSRIVQARHFAAYILRNNNEMTYQDIGDILQKDHSTVISAVKRMKARLEDDSLAELYGALLDDIANYEELFQPIEKDKIAVYLKPEGTLHASDIQRLETLRAQWLGLGDTRHGINLDGEETGDHLWETYGHLALDRVIALSYQSALEPLEQETIPRTDQ